MKLTDWFDKKVKPSLVGLYQVDPFHNKEIRWSYWDGKKWGFFTTEKDRALLRRKETSHAFLRWRGLAEDPNRSKP